MKYIWICSILVCCCCLTAALSAQTSGLKTVTVTSTPAGAEATLAGEAIVSGITPVTFHYPLVGKYTLRVTKKGYETYSTDLLLDPGKLIEVDVVLSRKTRLKAFARSLIIPGWGQRYADRKTKGFAFTALSVLSVGAYLWADSDFDEKYDNYNKAVREYDNIVQGGSHDQIVAFYDRLLFAQDDAYDAENMRRIAVGAVVGIYALNLIDALFFFPEEKGTFSVKNLSMHPSADFKQVGMQLSFSF